ncbi:uncharacterized protein LOC122377334, partial [Amphibalanus amphitrite]|uniref:uncharacterized protein LOC122377334 n=1 Tax=Amphibalanus amphitrite TaxID=1232801 RepID=UPI001C91C195
MDVERLKRARAAARGWATRSCRALQLACSAPEPDCYEIQELKAEVEQRLSALDSSQAALEIEFDESELPEVVEEAADFRSGISKVLRTAGKLLLRDIDPNLPAHSGGASNAGTSGLPRLPKLDLPSFDGDVLKWLNFWECFQAAVGDKEELADITKLAYLRSLLRGEAAQCIAGLPLTGANFATASKLLQDRYGRTDLIIFKHVQGLLNMDRATEDVSSLQKLQDELQVHVRSLESLGVKGDNYGVILTPLLLSRLPKDICLAWARDSVGKEGDLVFLLEVLKAEVNSRVKSGVYSGLSAAGEKPTTASGVKTRPVDRDSGRRKRLQQPRSGAALQAASPGAGAGCEFCSGPHRATECPDFLSLSVSERQDKVRGANLCFVCLKGGHRARHCLEKCAHCKGRHNVLCCYKHVFDFTHKGVKASDAVSSDSAHVGSGSRPAAIASLSCVPQEVVRSLGGLELADGRFSSDRHLSVDLLVGLDQYWQLLKDGLLRTSAGLRRKLAKDPVLAERYDAALQEMEDAGVIEEVPGCELQTSYPVFYLPHRPVLKEDSSTTKVRPVFDASAVGPGGVSLNDCLEVGPCLVPSLLEILLRFRRWPFAIAADISKAFLQVQLRKEDRDVHRFLWWRNGRVRVMRFMRVTFGVRSSSFLLAATIRHHLTQYPSSPLISDLSENFYVDDYLSGADTESDACSKLKEAQTVMAGRPPSADGDDSASPEASLPREEMALLSRSGNPTALFEVERWGSLRKATRVVAWVKRFVFNCRNPGLRRQSELSGDEIAEARTALVRDAQQAAFPEE